MFVVTQSRASTAGNHIYVAAINAETGEMEFSCHKAMAKWFDLAGARKVAESFGGAVRMRADCR